MEKEEEDTYYYLGFFWNVLPPYKYSELADFSIDTVKMVVKKALSLVVGKIAVDFDILTYYVNNNYGIIRCRKSSYIPLKSCLPIEGKLNKRTFSFHIDKASPNLLSLLTSSRRLIHVQSKTVTRKRKLNEMS